MSNNKLVTALKTTAVIAATGLALTGCASKPKATALVLLDPATGEPMMMAPKNDILTTKVIKTTTARGSKSFLSAVEVRNPKQGEPEKGDGERTETTASTITETTITETPVKDGGGRVIAGYVVDEDAGTKRQITVIARSPVSESNISAMNGEPVVSDSPFRTVTGGILDIGQGLGALGVGAGATAFGLRYEPASYNETTNVSNGSKSEGSYSASEGGDAQACAEGGDAKGGDAYAEGGAGGAGGAGGNATSNSSSTSSAAAAAEAEACASSNSCASSQSGGGGNGQGSTTTQPGKYVGQGSDASKYIKMPFRVASTNPAARPAFTNRAYTRG